MDISSFSDELGSSESISIEYNNSVEVPQVDLSTRSGYRVGRFFVDLYHMYTQKFDGLSLL